ncbi:hypothetical protein BSNK01_28230 [Bacillaceae bacterium]
MKKQPHANICGAKTRSGAPCKNRPMANGRCRLHGGKSTGPPKGNKNALKTGEYETIWLDTLDDDERVLFDAINTDVAQQLDEEIRLITIRERRIMKRIQSLKQQKHVLEEITESDEYGTIKRFVETLIRIHQFEEALTRVQEKKTRLLELKYKVMSANTEEGDSLAGLVEAIRESAMANESDPDSGGDE